MSDTTDFNGPLAQALSGSFVDRCRYRFINAAISVTTESSSTTSHAQRLAFAGALFANQVDKTMLTMAALSNASIRAEVIADPSDNGGNATDSDMDFQISSVFTGIATSRAW
jgi:hypothetical protein